SPYLLRHSHRTVGSCTLSAAPRSTVAPGEDGAATAGDAPTVPPTTKTGAATTAAARTLFIMIDSTITLGGARTAAGPRRKRSEKTSRPPFRRHRDFL